MTLYLEVKIAYSVVGDREVQNVEQMDSIHDQIVASVRDQLGHTVFMSKTQDSTRNEGVIQVESVNES